MYAFRDIKVFLTSLVRYYSAKHTHKKKCVWGGGAVPFV